MKYRNGFLLCCLFSATAVADLVVVKDYGGKPTNVPTEAQLSAQRNAFKQEHSQGRFVPSAPPTFPVISESLRVGYIERHPHNKNVHTHFFILGADNDSVKWLRANKTVLQNMGAKGFVTNVANANDFNILKKIAEPLSLEPVNVDEIAAIFNLHFYPVLITPKEIVQ